MPERKPLMVKSIYTKPIASLIYEIISKNILEIRWIICLDKLVLIMIMIYNGKK